MSDGFGESKAQRWLSRSTPKGEGSDWPAQVTVAKAMGRSQRFVSRCELGERRVDAVEFRDFCKVYGLPPSHFLDGFASEE